MSFIFPLVSTPASLFHLPFTVFRSNARALLPLSLRFKLLSTLFPLRILPISLLFPLYSLFSPSVSLSFFCSCFLSSAFFLCPAFSSSYYNISSSFSISEYSIYSYLPCLVSHSSFPFPFPPHLSILPLSRPLPSSFIFLYLFLSLIYFLSSLCITSLHFPCLAFSLCA